MAKSLQERLQFDKKHVILIASQHETLCAHGPFRIESVVVRLRHIEGMIARVDWGRVAEYSKSKILKILAFSGIVIKFKTKEKKSV